MDAMFVTHTSLPLVPSCPAQSAILRHAPHAWNRFRKLVNIVQLHSKELVCESSYNPSLIVNLRMIGCIVPAAATTFPWALTATLTGPGATAATAIPTPVAKGA